MRGLLHTISYVVAFVMLSPMALEAQNAITGVRDLTVAAANAAGGQILPGDAQNAASVTWLPSDPDGSAVYDARQFHGNFLGLEVENPSTDLDSKGHTLPAMKQPDSPGLDAAHALAEKRQNMAFLNVASPNDGGRSGGRDKVIPIILGLAVHATVTWDAQSTNHFFHHYPAGYRPFEVDPLMRPFAGKPLMYPMANLLFAAPFDLLAFKTAHSRKPVRILTYAASGLWSGLEMHQSMVNIGNERARSSRQ